MGVFRGWSKLVDEAELSETEPVQFRLPLPSRRGDVLAGMGPWVGEFPSRYTLRTWIISVPPVI